MNEEATKEATAANVVLTGEIEMSSQVDLGRITAPPLEAKAAKPVVKALPEISAGAKLTQKIIESMDLKRQERARLVAAMKSREVEVERENVAARKRAEDALAALKEEFDRRVLTVKSDFDSGIQARFLDLQAREGQIVKLDVTLANFRTQLNAEISKLDPDTKGGA